MGVRETTAVDDVAHPTGSGHGLLAVPPGGRRHCLSRSRSNISRAFHRPRCFFSVPVRLHFFNSVLQTDPQKHVTISCCPRMELLQAIECPPQRSPPRRPRSMFLGACHGAWRRPPLPPGPGGGSMSIVSAEGGAAFRVQRTAHSPKLQHRIDQCSRLPVRTASLEMVRPAIVDLPLRTTVETRFCLAPCAPATGPNGSSGNRESASSPPPKPPPRAVVRNACSWWKFTCAGGIDPASFSTH
jgi:hypothetical protein